MDRLRAQLGPALGSAAATASDTSLTVGGLMGRGPDVVEHLLLNEQVLAVADAILLPECPMAASSQAVDASDLVGVLAGSDGVTQVAHPRRDADRGPSCHHYRVGGTAGLQIRSGGKHQVLHRETIVYEPFLQYEPSMPEFIIAVMWAATAFTADNGATRLVPGSHRWPPDRLATEREVVPAVMPKGSALIWLGKVLHGAGASHSDAPRLGLLFTLVTNWLAQEENQYVAVPPETARSLPARARQLLGYRSSPTVGWVKGRDGNDLLGPGSGAPSSGDK